MAVTYTSGYPATATGYAFTDNAMALLRRYFSDFKMLNDLAKEKGLYDYANRGSKYAPNHTPTANINLAATLTIMQAAFAGHVVTAGIDNNSINARITVEGLYSALHLFRVEMIAVLSSLPLYITQASKTTTPSYTAGKAIAGLTYATGFDTTPTFVNTTSGGGKGIYDYYKDALDALAAMLEAYDRYLNVRGQFIAPTTYAVIAPMTDGLMDALNAAWLCTVSGGAVTGGLIHTMRAEACDLFADARGFFYYS